VNVPLGVVVVVASSLPTFEGVSTPADQDQPEHVKTTSPARPDKARPSPFGPAAIRSSSQQIGWRWIQAKVAALTGARCVRRALVEDARVRDACRRVDEAPYVSDR